MTDDISAARAADFHSLLNHERAALRAFVDLLQKEQQCLLNQDSDELIRLADAKTLSANKLAELANARRQLQNSADAHLDTAAWVLKHAPSSRTAWDEIRKLAEHAHHLNQTNGEVIQLRIRSNQQALTALLGAAKNIAGVYGRDGQPNLGISGRTLGTG